MEKRFDRSLKDLLTFSGVEHEELARYLGVPVPMMNRWLNGVGAPDVYQFREIAHFFGMPYDWFLKDKGSISRTEELAAKLGLSTDTVDRLLKMVAEGGNDAVLKAVDNTLSAALSIPDGVFEDLDRYVNKTIGERRRLENA